MFWKKDKTYEETVFFVVWTVKQGNMQDTNTDLFFTEDEANAFIDDLSKSFGDVLVSSILYFGKLKSSYIMKEKGE